MIPALEARHGPLRGPTVGGHLAGIGGPRGLSRPGRWSATTSAASPTPTTWPAAAEAGATVVATHIRLAPRVPDPEPVYDDVVADVVRPSSLERAERAAAAGIAPDRIVLDAGLDLGKTAEQSLTLLRASDRLAALGFPLLLSASNKTFLGKVLDLEIGERREASLAATALGVALGCRVVRVHDVAGSRQVCDVLARRVSGRGSASPVSPPRRHDDRPVYLVKGDDPSLVAQQAHVAGRAAGGRGRPVADGGGVRWAVRRPGRGRRGDRRLHHPALPGRPPGGGPPRRRPADLRRRQAPARPTWPIRCPTTVLVLVAGGGTVPPALSKQVGGGRRGGRHLGGPDRQAAVAVAGRAPEGRPGPPRRSGRPPGSPTISAGTWAGWPGCSAALASAYGRGVDGRRRRARAVPGRGRLGRALGPHRRGGRRRRPPGAWSSSTGCSGRRVPTPWWSWPPPPPLPADAAARRLGDHLPEEAADALGLKSSFPARKALWPRAGGWARPGSPGPSGCWPMPTSTSAGSTALPGEVVLEVLVARLAAWAVRSGADRVGRLFARVGHPLGPPEPVPVAELVATGRVGLPPGGDRRGGGGSAADGADWRCRGPERLVDGDRLLARLDRATGSAVRHG